MGYGHEGADNLCLPGAHLPGAHMVDDQARAVGQAEEHGHHQRKNALLANANAPKGLSRVVVQLLQPAVALGDLQNDYQRNNYQSDGDNSPDSLHKSFPQHRHDSTTPKSQPTASEQPRRMKKI